MNASKDVVFVFAHQDDEYGALPWIEHEIRSSNNVWCVYLTDGASRVPAAVRDYESRSALISIGVLEERIIFLGDEKRIRDGYLLQHMDRAADVLQIWLHSVTKTLARIYAPSWEGGHPDHDAAHLISGAVAASLGIADECWHFPLYNAHNCPRPLFRTLRHIPRSAASRTVRYSIARGLRFAFFCWHYRSQARTWLGLFPESLIRRVFLRRETVVRFDRNRVNQRPHAGELLYERMFETTYCEAAAHVKRFRNSGALPAKDDKSVG